MATLGQVYARWGVVNRVSPYTCYTCAFGAGSIEASGLSSFSSNLTLATWRGARGESTETRRGIFRTVVYRAAKSGWWGTDAGSVSLKAFQFSCFNHGANNLST